MFQSVYIVLEYTFPKFIFLSYTLSLVFMQRSVFVANGMVSIIATKHHENETERKYERK